MTTVSLEAVNVIVVGEEWNPTWLTTDFTHVRTASVDKWMPKTGKRSDEYLLRMAVVVTCKDEVCGLLGSNGPAWSVQKK